MQEAADQRPVLVALRALVDRMVAALAHAVHLGVHLGGCRVEAARRARVGVTGALPVRREA